jgi:putative tricarboxylic transport membrane protein
MREKKMGNMIASLVIIGGSLFFYYLAGQLPVVKGYQKMGDSFWPRLILLVLMGLSAILLIQSYLARKHQKAAAKADSEEKTGRGDLVLMMAAIVLYVVAIPYLGFLLSTFLALIAFSYLMGDRKALGMVFFSLGMTAAIYVVFGLIIYTALPRGVWIFKTLSTYIY